MMTSRDQLAQFAACVYEPLDIVELRCLRKGEAKKTWCTAAELPDYADRLDKGNAAGWDIYAGAIPRSAKGLSGDANVATYRVLFVDFDHIDADGCSPSEIAISRIEDAGLPQPTLVVFSGHGVHCYWRLREPVTEPVWRDLQARLIQALDSDKAIKNPERIMRLPGFKNLKREPVDTFIVDADPTRRYAADLFEQVLPPLTPSATPADRTEPATRPDHDHKTAKARAILYASKWPSCGEGGRNNEAYRHAAQLRQFNLAEGDASEILSDWNRTNTPPLPESELRQALASAYSHAKGTIGEKLTESRPARPPAPLPATAATTEPVAELEALVEKEIDGQFTNIDWPWPMLSDMGQCLTPGTRTMIVGSIGGSKSLFVLQALASWIDAGIKCAVLELERSRDFHLKRVLAQHARIADVTKPKWVAANPQLVRDLVAEHREALNKIGAAIHCAPRQLSLVQAAEWIEARCNEGCRIIAIDPITALARSAEPWRDDDAFMSRAEKAASSSGASLVFVTHSKKGGAGTPDLDSLAGSAAWARFPDAVLWLQAHDLRVSTIKTSCGTDEQPHDRVLHLLKTRSGEGTGLRLAYRFELGREPSDHGALTLRELGILVKRGKQ